MFASASDLDLVDVQTTNLAQVGNIENRAKLLLFEVSDANRTCGVTAFLYRNHIQFHFSLSRQSETPIDIGAFINVNEQCLY